MYRNSNSITYTGGYNIYVEIVRGEISRQIAGNRVMRYNNHMHVNIVRKRVRNDYILLYIIVMNCRNNDRKNRRNNRADVRRSALQVNRMYMLRLSNPTSAAAAAAVQLFYNTINICTPVSGLWRKDVCVKATENKNNRTTGRAVYFFTITNNNNCSP